MLKKCGDGSTSRKGLLKRVPSNRDLPSETPTLGKRVKKDWDFGLLLAGQDAEYRSAALGALAFNGGATILQGDLLDIIQLPGRFAADAEPGVSLGHSRTSFGGMIGVAVEAIYLLKSLGSSFYGG